MLRNFFAVIRSLFRFGPERSVFEGTVRWIPDGDTIHLDLPDQTIRKVRLFGIDAPEIGRRDDGIPPQDGSEEALKFLRSRTRNAILQVETVGIDKFGRVLGIVSLPGSAETLNEAMARHGHAWHHPSRDLRHPVSDSIAELAGQARADSIGLWARPDPVHPRDFRRSAAFGQPYSSAPGMR